MPAWVNNMDDWNADHPGHPLTVQGLKDSFFTMVVLDSDHFNFNATIEADVAGVGLVRMNSDVSLGMIGSDQGHVPTRTIRFFISPSPRSTRSVR